MLKLADLDLPAAVLIDLSNQLLDVDGHLEVLLDYPDEFIGIDAATAVLVPPESDVGAEGVLIVLCALLPLHLVDYGLELGEGHLPGGLRVGEGQHPVDLVLRRLLAEGAHDNLKLLGVDGPVAVLVEGAEGPEAPGPLLIGQAGVVFLFGFFLHKGVLVFLSFAISSLVASSSCHGGIHFI